MTGVYARCRQVFSAYDATRRPGAYLYVIVLLLYLPSLFGGFLLDDHRCVQCLREFHEGRRDSLGVYNFLPGGEANIETRESGRFHWWVREDVRYRHLRLVSETVLYGEYLVFGDSPLGYRLVGLVLYMAGVRLVLAFFRQLSGDERLSRWAALLFAVATCHTIPVIFISAHCDLIALVLVCGMLALMGRYVLDARKVPLFVAIILFAASLNSKEAALASALAPLCYWLVRRGDAGVRRRAIFASIALTIVGLTWLACYVAGGYGSNAAIMLNPIHAPLDYLVAFPGRVLMLLSAWPIPINPFLFYLAPASIAAVSVYMALGGIALILIGRLLWKYHRRQQGLAAMAFFVFLFMPILACTTPDDRVLMLPSMGLAFLGAVWMVGVRKGNDASKEQRVIRRLPAFLFVLVQMSIVLATTGIMFFMEAEAQKHLRMMVDAFDRPTIDGDRVVFVNTARSYEALFTQDRLHALPGCEGVGASVLCDVVAPEIEVVDDHTLRLTSKDRPFLQSFVGMISSPAHAAWKIGETLDAGAFASRIVGVDKGAITVVEIRFDEPLISDHYRFFWSYTDGPPILLDAATFALPGS